MTSLRLLMLASIAVALACLAGIASAAVVLALRAGGRRQLRVDDREALSESRFTIPVSLIVSLAAPLRVSLDRASRTIDALLGLHYPQHEVIVIAEGLAAADWERLKAAWQLEAREFFYRQALATAPVRMVYRSTRDSRLMVVDKEPADRPDGPALWSATYADALNCGVNLSRFRYVGAVDASVDFDPDTLLRAMAGPMRDPAVIVGASSQVEVADTEAIEAATDTALSASMQRLASIRSLMDSRIVWPRLPDGIGPRDAAVVWRREAIVQCGGFSKVAADPEVEMMARLQTGTAPGAGGAIVRSAEIFGRIQARRTRELAGLTARRNRAALDAITALASAGRKHASVVAYLVGSEVAAPLLHAYVLAATTIAAGAGWLAWRDVALAVVLLSFGRAAVSAAALILRGSLPGAPDERRLMRLLLAAPLELAIAGPAAAVARFAGFWSFLKSPASTGPAA